MISSHCFSHLYSWTVTFLTQAVKIEISLKLHRILPLDRVPLRHLSAHLLGLVVAALLVVLLACVELPIAHGHVNLLAVARLAAHLDNKKSD